MLHNLFFDFRCCWFIIKKHRTNGLNRGWRQIVNVQTQEHDCLTSVLWRFQPGSANALRRSSSREPCPPCRQRRVLRSRIGGWTLVRLRWWSSCDAPWGRRGDCVSMWELSDAVRHASSHEGCTVHRTTAFTLSHRTTVLLRVCQTAYFVWIYKS